MTNADQSNDLTGQLEKVAKLHSDGKLSDNEFAQLKATLLSKTTGSPSAGPNASAPAGLAATREKPGISLRIPWWQRLAAVAVALLAFWIFGLGAAVPTLWTRITQDLSPQSNSPAIVPPTAAAQTANAAPASAPSIPSPPPTQPSQNAEAAPPDEPQTTRPTAAIAFSCSDPGVIEKAKQAVNDLYDVNGLPRSDSDTAPLSTLVVGNDVYSVQLQRTFIASFKHELGEDDILVCEPSDESLRPAFIMVLVRKAGQVGGVVMNFGFPNVTAPFGDDINVNK